MSNCIVSGSVVSSYGLIQQLQGSLHRGCLMALLAHVHALARKQADRFELDRVNKPDDDLLHPGLFICRQRLANHGGDANQL
jgi:hypothetical protein